MKTISKMLHTPALIWLLLMIMTLLSFYLTDSSTLAWVTGVILLLTALKGHLIVESFMELHGINHLIRTAMLLYCPVLGVIIYFVLSH
ncbi:cytochrome C oxidase subunit IV family protein [Motiliproteus coralliicola]|nr:cytochrome C oxidase subunit IV family protein [Motiliproteus coralliicola]